MLRHARGIRGQASILVGAMMLTFLLFFSFVLHTGMLVNAKINLQNAADLAAYAGAAAQARQMNAIAHLNYEMRRQYKKFLFRYYVVGQRGYSGGGPASGRFAKWVRNGTGSQNLGVPTICIHFLGNDNYCQIKGKLSSLQAGVYFNASDPIAAALQQQIQALDQLRLKSGDIVDQIQAIVTMLWLYNADPALTTLAGQLQSAGPNAAKIVRDLNAIAQGLGVVPRLYLLKARAETLAKILNERAKTQVTSALADRLEREEFAAASERTVLAFRSAYKTLGERAFDEDSIAMDELLPSTVFSLGVRQENFDVYYLKLLREAESLPRPNHLDDPANQYFLTGYPERISVFGLPVALYKRQESLTSYAVRLTAKARLYFANPFGSEIELSAYAAARPFGSRLGPWDESQWGYFTTAMAPPSHPNNHPFYEGKPLQPFRRDPCINFGGGSGNATVANCAGRVPNLPVRSGVLANGPEAGFLSLSDALAPLSRYFQSASGGSITPEATKRSELVAMTPNPFELGLYSIPFDGAGGDAFIENFSEQELLSVYAPIYPPGFDNVAEIRSAILDDLLKSKMEQGTAQMIADGITNYVSNLRNVPGEDGETFQIARIRDPWQQDPAQPLATLHLPNPSAAVVKTAWSDSWNRKDAAPRAGYSVKFVTFASLLGAQTLTDGASTRPTNSSELQTLLGEDAFGLRQPASH